MVSVVVLVFGWLVCGMGRMQEDMVGGQRLGHRVRGSALD